jgi:DGQHR domain-containing protein
VPKNPFSPKGTPVQHCLCALDVEKIMDWWPGTPHSPDRDPEKVKAIQRSLDWKRVAHIAAYLLQKELHDVSNKIDNYFGEIYEPMTNEPGREWPPKVGRVIGFSRSEFPTFSNILIHVNGASLVDVNGAKIEKIATPKEEEAAYLVLDESDKRFKFSVIDGQHRINGAYLAVRLLKDRKEKTPDEKYEIPVEVFLDLDAANAPPQNQAQIFIDVNFYQKKVDRSLVADLFPTARGKRDPLDDKERAQDIGRALMLDTGPLVGMIRIPGIRYGAKEVITLSTLNGAIEDNLSALTENGIEGLGMQTEFLARCLTAWLDASGGMEQPSRSGKVILRPQNVAYQGRILVSVLDLMPAIIWKIKKAGKQFVSDGAQTVITDWLKEIANRAELLENGVFISKDKFKQYGYLGSGGIGRFRDLLWAAVGEENPPKGQPEASKQLADKNRAQVWAELAK